jgi:SAM-dependent methyltransferase
MDDSFSHYLLSKQTVDDRALNKDVLNALRLSLSQQPVSVIEVGAGIGTMLRRLIQWGVLCNGEYTLVDALNANIAYARDWIPQWATEAGLSVEGFGANQLRVRDRTRDIRIRLERADVFDFIQGNQQPADLLIAHAFLDLLPMPESLEKLFSLTKGLAWLTLNFDGMTVLQPTIDDALDEKIERLYHKTMDTRPTGGNSCTGRRLFDHLRSSYAEIIAAGASDWVVHATNGEYPADEKYFLHFILNFFESSLKTHPELDAATLKGWLAKRREQIERGELVYIAHQIDFLVHKGSGASSL